MRDLRQILRSGYVRRWHSNPDMAHTGETLAHHHAQVAQIIMALHPDPSRALIDAALHHDCREMGLEWRLTSEERRWLKFADRLAAYAFMLHTAPHVGDGDGWPEGAAWLEREASALGVADAVAGVIGGRNAAALIPASRGRWPNNGEKNETA